MNVPSSVYGKKDIVKVENRTLKPSEVNQIAIISPNASINIIKDYKVVKKEIVKLPDQIIGSIECSNPNCVSNKEREPVEPVLDVKQKDPLVLVCRYCERILS